MSGGIAYVLDEDGTFEQNCNKEMVLLEQLTDEREIGQVKAMIRNHADYTDSIRAWKVLAKWSELIPKFVKVYPKDFKRMLESIEEMQKNGMDNDEAELEAFYANRES